MGRVAWVELEWTEDGALWLKVEDAVSKSVEGKIDQQVLDED